MTACFFPQVDGSLYLPFLGKWDALASLEKEGCLQKTLFSCATRVAGFGLLLFLSLISPVFCLYSICRGQLKNSFSYLVHTLTLPFGAIISLIAPASVLEALKKTPTTSSAPPPPTNNPPKPVGSNTSVIPPSTNPDELDPPPAAQYRTPEQRRASTTAYPLHTHVTSPVSPPLESLVPPPAPSWTQNLEQRRTTLVQTLMGYMDQGREHDTLEEARGKAFMRKALEQNTFVDWYLERNWLTADRINGDGTTTKASEFNPSQLMSLILSSCDKPGELKLGSAKVFYCSQMNVTDKEFLNRNRVTHILNVPGVNHDTAGVDVFPDDFVYVHGGVQDTQNSPIRFDEMIAPLIAATRRGENVCVHCLEGRNRSAAAMIALVMTFNGIGIKEAEEQVRSTGRRVEIHPPIRLQLIRWAIAENRATVTDIEEFLAGVKPSDLTEVNRVIREVTNDARMMAMLDAKMQGNSDIEAFLQSREDLRSRVTQLQSDLANATNYQASGQQERAKHYLRKVTETLETLRASLPQIFCEAIDLKIQNLRQLLATQS